MKKFYSLSLLALAAASLNAATVNIDIKQQPVSRDAMKVRTATFTTQSIAPAKAASRATDFNSLTWKALGEGKYAASAIPGCYGGSTEPQSVQVFEAESKAGLYKVVGVWADVVQSNAAVLYVDASDPEFVLVEKQSTGITDTVDGITYISSLSAVAVSEYDYTKAEFITDFPDQNATLANGVIAFPKGSLMLQWPEAPEDSSYGTDATEWYSYAKVDGMLVLPGGEYVDPWGEAVDATFVEDLITSTLTGAANLTPYTVQVQKYADSDRYRVLNPWKQLYASLSLTGTSPELEIDATDPTNVSIELQSTGLGNATDGSYYVMSESYYCDVTGETLADELKITLTDNADGTTTITVPHYSTTVLTSTTQKFYYGSMSETPSTLTFKTFTEGAGIANVSAAANDAPVEYFNLQGVRVNNPAEGQLVIKRQGSEVTKTIIR